MKSEEGLNLGAPSGIPPHLYFFPECEPVGATSKCQKVVKVNGFNSDIYS